MIQEGIQVDLSAHRAGDGSSGAGGLRCARNGCAGLLDRCARLLDGCTSLLNGYTCLLDGCSGFGAGENTRHLAEVQWALDLRWGDRGSSLCQGGKGQQSGKHELRFHGWWCVWFDWI